MQPFPISINVSISPKHWKHNFSLRSENLIINDKRGCFIYIFLDFLIVLYSINYKTSSHEKMDKPNDLKP